MHSSNKAFLYSMGRNYYSYQYASSPIVEHIRIRPVEPFDMRTLHRYSLHSPSIPASAHALAGMFTSTSR